MEKEFKIIALACSPSKKRNSDSMLDAFIEGMSECDQVAVEKIYLNDILIDYYSHKNSKGVGEHEAGFKNLIEKIQQSSGMVIATPTYNFSVPANLKNFIDRIRFISLDLEKINWLRQPTGKLDHLRVFFLVSGGTPAWAETILFFAFPAFWLRAVFLYYRAQCLGAYYSGDIRTFANTKKLEICKKLGRRYAKKIVRRGPQGILERLFWRPPQDE